MLYKCSLSNTAQEYLTQNSFGQIGSNQYPYKRYDNLPPHAAVIIDLSILFQNTSAPPLPPTTPVDQISVIVDGSVIYKKGYKNLSDWIKNPVCTSIFESIDYVSSNSIIHNNPSLQVSIRNNFNLNSGTQSKFVVRQFKLFLDLCDPSCTSCQYISTDKCDSCNYFTGAYIDSITKKCICPSGYYLYNKMCYSSCPIGTVAKSSGNCELICSKDDCLICQNQTICTSCKPPKLLQQNICVDKCSSGFILNQGFCQQLSSIFSNGLILVEVFQNQIFNQSYIDSLGFIITKTGPSRTLYTNDIQFSYCGDDKILGGYLTLSSFKIEKSFSGLPPHSNIKQNQNLQMQKQKDNWNGESVIITIDNIETKFTFNNISGSSGTFKCGLNDVKDQVQEFEKEIVHTGQILSFSIESVLDSNPDVKSFGIRDLYIILSACSQFCQVCDAKNCIECMPGKIFYNKQCYQKCPEGLYYNGTTCIACHPSCASCDPNILIGNKCLTCNSSRVNNPPYCGCYKGFYDDNLSKDCQQCSKFCLDCNSSTQCNSCQGNRIGTLCSCPSNTYDNNQMICQQCHFFCDGCNGPNISDCIACKGNRIYPGCTCPLNTLDNGNSLICPKCNPGCKSCSLVASNCNGCSSSTREGIDCKCKSGMMETYQNDCIKCETKCKSCQNTPDNCNADCAGNRLPPDCSCPKYYYDNNTEFCVACPYKCIDCNMKGECTQCASIRVNKPNCDCPAGYFDQGLTDCQQCSNKCSECSLSQDTCTQCSINRVSPPECQCANGYFEDPITKICQRCFNNCKKCTGKLQPDCLECLENRINKPQCVCPSKTYENGQIRCPSCFLGCIKCFGSQFNQCSQCTMNRYLDGNNKCICRDGFYNDGVSEDCLPCHFKCKTCSQYSVCDECAANRNNKPECSCPQFSFDTGQSSCEECPFKCIECDKVTKSCITCRADRDKSLECQCKGNTYDDGYNQNCQCECYKNCQGCQGGGPKNCKSCKDTYQKFENGMCQCDTNAYENNGICICKSSFIMKNSKCVKQTDGEEDFDDNDGQGNKNCSVKYCRKCYKNSICLKCLQNRVLMENVCVCQFGFYQKTYDGKTFCQKCSLKNCFSCDINDKCVRCDNDFFLTFDKNSNEQICLETYLLQEESFQKIYILYFILLLLFIGILPFVCKKLYILILKNRKQENFDKKQNPKLTHPSKFAKERQKYQKMINKKQIKQSSENQGVKLLKSQKMDNKKQNKINNKYQDDNDNKLVFLDKDDDIEKDLQNNKDQKINQSQMKNDIQLNEDKQDINMNINRQQKQIKNNKNTKEIQMIKLDTINANSSNQSIYSQNRIYQSNMNQSNLLYSNPYKHQLGQSELKNSQSKITLNQKEIKQLQKQLVS